MSNFDDSEAWRQVPPEVKLEIMARSQSQGFLHALGFVLIASTCAVALQFVWLMWGSLIFSPVVFQLSANKAWRALRPATLLRYLAAKSAARRFAYAARSQDLTLDLIFPAFLKRRIDKDDISGALEAAIDKNRETEVWVTLFKDAIVMMSERPGGAKVEFAQRISNKIKLESYSPSGGDYSNDKELMISAIMPNTLGIGSSEVVANYQLSSRYPAALIVFEKELKKRLAGFEFPDIVEATTTSDQVNLDTHNTDDEDDIFARQF